jgi:hypothetical protein
MLFAGMKKEAALFEEIVNNRVLSEFMMIKHLSMNHPFPAA